MEKYCDIVDIENLILKEIDDNFEAQVEIWISAVSRIMDNMANRTLVAPAVGSGEEYPVKYFDGDGTRKLLIGDCQEIVSLKIGDEFGDDMVEYASTEYVLSPKTPPSSSVILKDEVFTMGIQNVAIEGRFGLFSTIPDDIRLACAVLVAGIINNQDKGNQSKSSESIGNYSVSYDTEFAKEQYNQAINTIISYRYIKF